MCACVRACVRAGVRACVRACVCVYIVYVYVYMKISPKFRQNKKTHMTNSIGTRFLGMQVIFITVFSHK